MWDYKTELGLSDKQVADLKGAAQAFDKIMSDAREKLQKLNEKFIGQVRQEASIELIKVTLEEIAAVQIEVRLVDIKTMRAINHTLTPEQLAKWRGIQQAASGTK